MTGRRWCRHRTPRELETARRRRSSHGPRVARLRTRTSPWCDARASRGAGCRPACTAGYRGMGKDGTVIVSLVLLPLAYLLGTFPSAVLVARARGIDITTAGSGNPGASNVSRLLGRKLGVFVFVLDGLKGALSVLAGFVAFEYAGALMLACAAVVGHVFPITRRFKGGKGVATAGGAMLALYPIVSLGLLVLWLGVVKITKKASLASLSIVVGLPIGLVIVARPASEIFTTIGLGVFVIWRHWPNLKRLLSGQELSSRRGA
ncbi:MAG: glycerol-3-phosphate 1-O-acyltransferase [Acidimicrobiia bacterium]|nr:glycerol-3-phosphate 1-O-acyltransferase [Acidimicrobiia bacterium]